MMMKSSTRAPATTYRLHVHAVLAAAALTFSVAAGGCVRHEVEPVTVEPIHITVDVNLRVDRQLEDFFDFEEEIERELEDGPDDTLPGQQP